MDRKDITLREKKKSQNYILCDSTYVTFSKWDKIIELKNRFVVAKG